MPKLLGVRFAVQLLLDMRRRVCAGTRVPMCAGLSLQCL
jgi:hypothetical protein